MKTSKLLDLFFSFCEAVIVASVLAFPFVMYFAFVMEK